MNRHQVQVGPDGIRWVCIEPLMQDLTEAMDTLMQIPTDNLTDKDKHILDMKILSLKTIYEFMGSLVTASKLAEIKMNMQDKENNDENTTGQTLH